MLSSQPRSYYVDEAGEPRLRDSFVLFMDLLGTRGIRSGADSLEHFQAVRAAVQGARSACFSPDGSPDQVEMQWFSDNLALAYPVDGFQPASRLSQLLAEVSYLHVAFVDAGLLGRGAITRGDFFADDTFIYGPALERAVALEHSRAVYPRCVVDEATYSIATDTLMIGDAGGTQSVWRKQLAVDQDGVVFVDYLQGAYEDPAGYGIDMDGLLTRHKRLIESNLYRYDGMRTIEDKYRWLAGYHNHTVDTLSARGDVFASQHLTVSRAAGGFTAFGG